MAAPTTYDIVTKGIKDSFSYFLNGYASLQNMYAEAIEEYIIKIEANKRLTAEKREALIKAKLEELRRTQS
jgi:hypothetical protein